MHPEEAYKSIGYAIVVLFVIYVAARSLQFQTSVIIEGLEQKQKKSSAQIDAENERTEKQVKSLRSKNDNSADDIERTRERMKLDESELSDEYKRRFDMMFDTTNLAFVQYVLDNADTIISNPLSSSSLGVMGTINTVKMFLENLSYVTGAMDSASGGGGGGGF